MIKLGELNRRIEVLENADYYDNFGKEVCGWITVGRVWSKVSETNSNDNFENLRFVMRFYPAMSIRHRIKYMDKLYEVVEVKDIQGNRFTEINTNLI